MREKNGVLVSLMVPFEKAIFTNDLAYWQDTPWNRKGNPARTQNEVVVADQIKPEWIISKEKITHELGGSGGSKIRAKWFVENYAKVFYLNSRSMYHNAFFENLSVKN